MTVKETLANTILQGKDHEEGHMVWTCCDSEGNPWQTPSCRVKITRKDIWFGHVVTVKGTLTNTILQGKDHEEGHMVWKCCEGEGNPGKHHLAG